jgi:hypothetical protein
MTPPLTLRAALTRGAIVTLANWPVVLIDFVVESIYKFTLGVPVVAGAFMVAVLLGVDIGALLDDGLLSAAEQVIVPLTNAPSALLAFVAALSIVGIGGAVVMFMVKAGTLAVLVAGEGVAGEVHRHPLSKEGLRGAHAYSLAAVLHATRHFQRRSARLALGLGIAYLALGGLYVLIVVDGFRWVAESEWSPAWPLLVFVATSGAAVAMTAVNLFFDLARVVLITDDCRVREALNRVRAFLLADARQVLGVFGVMGAIVLLATAAGFTATAGLTLVAWVPLVGLLFVPLQLAFWVVRGLLFHHGLDSPSYRRTRRFWRRSLPLQVHRSMTNVVLAGRRDHASVGHRKGLLRVRT